MLRILELVSRSKLMKGGGELGMVLRWLGRLGDKRAQRENPRSNSNMEKLTAEIGAAVARDNCFR